MPERPRTLDDIRLDVERTLARAGVDGPRELAIHLAMNEGLSADEALARCGVRVPEPEPGSRQIEFVRLPHGEPFRQRGVRYRKVSARAAKALAVGAPNAVPIDGGAPVWISPGHLVERIPTVVVPVRRGS